MGRILAFILLLGGTLSARPAEPAAHVRFQSWLLEPPSGWSRWQEGGDLVFSSLDGEASIRITGGEEYQGSLSEWLMRTPGRMYGDRSKVILSPQSATANADGYPILLQPAHVERDGNKGQYFLYGAANPDGRAELAVYSAISESAFQKHVETFKRFLKQQSFAQPQESRTVKAIDTATSETAEAALPPPSDDPPSQESAAKHDGSEQASGAERDNAGFVTEVLRQKVAAGGKLKLGDYACAELFRQSSVLSPKSFKLRLLHTGEWRKIGPELDASGRPRETLGRMKYTANDGRFEIESSVWRLVNDEQGVRWSRFFTNGRDAVIVAEEKGDERKKTLCEWVADAEQPSMSSDQIASRRTDSMERVQEPWSVVTAPNGGLPLSAIERIVYQVSGNTGPKDYYFQQRAYLLLKDGSLYSALKCAPADLDVTASRRLEPEHWHRWKRGAKSSYWVQWSDRPGKWEKLEGAPVGPMRKGRRIEGAYQGVNAYFVESTTGVVARSMRFDQDGRFLTTSTGMHSWAPLPTERSVKAPESRAIRESNNKLDNLAAQIGGSYYIDGYTLELRYDDGHVERLPAFFVDARQRWLNIDGIPLRLAEAQTPPPATSSGTDTSKSDSDSRIRRRAGDEQGYGALLAASRKRTEDPVAVFRNEPLAKSSRARSE